MTDLTELVDSLKREVAVPGTFATVYKSTTDDDLVGSLMDAFAAAQLDGFFLNQTLDLFTFQVTPDLSPAGRAAVLIYAAERILTMQVMGLRQRSLYEAGSVKYETENSAQVLTQILKSLAERKKLVLGQADSARRTGTFAMQDMFADRLTGTEGAYIGGGAAFFAYELS